FGQRAEARILLEERRDVVRVPRAACEVEAARCFVLRDGRIAHAPVDFGLIGNEHADARGGLEPGDVLVDRRGFVGPPSLGRRVAAGGPGTSRCAPSGVSCAGSSRPPRGSACSGRSYWPWAASTAAWSRRPSCSSIAWAPISGSSSTARWARS